MVGRHTSCLGVSDRVGFGFGFGSVDIASALEIVPHSSSAELFELVQSFKGLRAFRIDLQDVIECSCSFIIFLKGFVDSSKAKMGIDISIVQINGILVVPYCLLVLLKVIKSGCEVKVTLRRLVVDREGLFICANRLLELVEHIKSIAQVVVCGGVVGIQFNGTVISFDSLFVL